MNELLSKGLFWPVLFWSTSHRSSDRTASWEQIDKGVSKLTEPELHQGPLTKFSKSNFKAAALFR